MSHDIARRLASFVVDTKSSDIPADVLQFAKSLTLKTIGGMIAGSRHPTARAMAELIRRRNQPAEVTVIGADFKTSLWDGILLNAFHAHARELEDDRFGGGVSWDITVIPLILSLAEKNNFSGRKTLEAIVLGLEVHARTCLFSAEHIGHTIVPGAIGPAAAAARALDLDIDRTMAAMGMTMSGVNLSLTNFGTDAHYLESAFHSLQAIVAAEAAQEGLTSNPDLQRYISTLLGIKPQQIYDLVDGLGERWLFLEIMIKKYSCCFLVHRQVDSILQAMREQALSYEDVASVKVFGSPADALCNRPIPATEAELQFSFQHAIGAALLDGDLGLEHFTADALLNPRYESAREKVTVEIDPNLSAYTMVARSRIGVTAKDGRVWEYERQHPIGSIHEPLSTAGIFGVYRKFAKGIISDEKIGKIGEAVLNLEMLNDIDGLTSML